VRRGKRGGETDIYGERESERDKETEIEIPCSVCSA
jgi:hypothetical protein